MTPKIFVYVHPAYDQTIFYTQTQLIFESFRACNVPVLIGDAFNLNNVIPGPDDQLIIYGNVDNYLDVVSQFPPRSRWLYVVDEGGAGEAAYDRSLAYMAKVDIKNIIVTYQNEAHLDKLFRRVKHLAFMPQTVPCIRPRKAKLRVILVSGQLHEHVYPTRTRLAKLCLTAPLSECSHFLPYPGSDLPTSTHSYHGDEYYKLLDTYTMGVVCRAGDRDRFVAKYVEMGASHVLPIGDCPSYMPRPMQRSMLNTEGMSDPDVINEVTRLIDNPEELAERTHEFTSVVAQRYLALPNVVRLLNDIRERATFVPYE